MKKQPFVFETATSAELRRAAHAPDVKWIVDDLIPPGCTLVHVIPGVGVPLLVLGIVVACLTGGKALGELEAMECEVLYLHLDEPDDDVVYRLENLLGGARLPDGIYMHTDHGKRVPLIGAGFEEALEAFLEKHPKVRLVVVDALDNISLPRPVGVKPYYHDRHLVSALSRLGKKHDTAIIAVYHDRDSASGSNGLLADVDVREWLGQDIEMSVSGNRVNGRRYDFGEDGVYTYRFVRNLRRVK